MDIKANIADLHAELDPQNVTLIAVSKTKPAEDVLEAYEAGQRDFGENKVQELVSKYEKLPEDIRWHMIGHLQRNKVKYIAPFVYLIHSVDSVRLLRAIQKEAEKSGRVLNCLLQVHIAEEETKFGLDDSELEEIIGIAGELEHVSIRGLMGMATFTTDESRIRREFASLKARFNDLKEKDLPQNISMDILSMGMSGDYEIATQEGSNMVRIGSSIFGERNKG